MRPAGRVGPRGRLRLPRGLGPHPFPAPNSSIVRPLFDHWALTNPSPQHLLRVHRLGQVVRDAVPARLRRGTLPGARRDAAAAVLLDKGGSDRCFLAVRGADALYIPFSPDSAPGIDIFRHSPDDEPLETHVAPDVAAARLLRLSEADAGPAAFRGQAAVQPSLFRVYEAGSASFASLEAELTRLGHGELAQALYPYRHG